MGGNTQKSFICFFSSEAVALCNSTTDKVSFSITAEKDFKKLMYGGINDELRHNKDFCDYYHHIISGDMKLLYYNCRDDKYIKLRCSVRLIEGTDDKCVIDKWKFYTDFAISVKYHKGGHFFINDYKQEIAYYIEKML